MRAPYSKTHFEFRRYPSSAEHEEFGVNPPGPPGKAKYDLSPIVHPVPRGKGEKNPGRGVK